MDDVAARLAVLENRVQELEDRDQIKQLAVRYGDVVDAHDAAGLRAQFTEDARWYWVNGVVDAQGIEAVMDALAGRWDTILGSFHVTHGHAVDMDPNDPDRATGLLLSHAEVLRENNPMISAVRYDDVYRRVSGEWLFAERKLSFYYYVNASTYVGDLVSGTPVNAVGTKLAADLSHGA